MKMGELGIWLFFFPSCGGSGSVDVSGFGIVCRFFCFVVRAVVVVAGIERSGGRKLWGKMQWWNLEGFKTMR